MCWINFPRRVKHLCISTDSSPSSGWKFWESTTGKGKETVWEAFKCVTPRFLAEERTENYRSNMEDLLTVYKHLGCNMSLKIDVLDGYINFPQLWQCEWRAWWTIPWKYFSQGENVSGQVKSINTDWLSLDILTITSQYWWTSLVLIPFFYSCTIYICSYSATTRCFFVFCKLLKDYLWITAPVYPSENFLVLPYSIKSYIFILMYFLLFW